MLEKNKIDDKKFKKFGLLMMCLNLNFFLFSYQKLSLIGEFFLAPPQIDK
jgi:hypothetical protein